MPSSGPQVLGEFPGTAGKASLTAEQSLTSRGGGAPPNTSTPGPPGTARGRGTWPGLGPGGTPPRALVSGRGSEPPAGVAGFWPSPQAARLCSHPRWSVWEILRSAGSPVFGRYFPKPAGQNRNADGLPEPLRAGWPWATSPPRPAPFARGLPRHLTPSGLGCMQVPTVDRLS